MKRRALVCTGVSCRVFCGHKGDEVILVLRFPPEFVVGSFPECSVVLIRYFVARCLT